MNRFIKTVVIALIFLGIGAVAADSNLNTFTLRADKVLADYIGGNATADKVNITGLIIQAGQVLGYYNESATDTLLDAKANQSDLVNHLNNVTGNPHSVTIGQVGAAASSHTHSGDNITSVVSSATDADMVDGKHYSDISNEIDSDIATHAGSASAHHTKTTSVSDLTDHNTANHDSLNIDADTLDGYDAGNAANKIPVLDSSGKYVGIPLRDVDGAVQYSTAELGSNDAEVSTTSMSWVTVKTVAVDLTNIDYIKVDYERKYTGQQGDMYARLEYGGTIYASIGGIPGASYGWSTGYDDVRALSGVITFNVQMMTSLGTRVAWNQGLDIHTNDFEGVDS